jgi:catechol 2,3-dioxygenase-like lactoylglutathione lyase family enzyme
LLAPSALPATPPPGKTMTVRIHHVNLVVADIRRMTAFYRDVLGLRQTRRATISGPWIEAVTGLPGVVADVAFLESDGGAGVELIAYRQPRLGRPGGQGEPNAPGIRHVAFEVADVDALAGALRAAGVELLGEVQQVPNVQVDYAERAKRLVYCRDPEGNLLELCSFG